MNVRTRFAPSPTGPVHIGNIRVAIYNWLFARNHNGSFLLRVEDTDHLRSTPEAIQILLDTLNWLNISIDEEPLYQSTRINDHLNVAEGLIQKGFAYRSKKGDAENGECILFRMSDKAISFTDSIKGYLSKGADLMEDFVIVRSNGTPVFHLANVLDDIEQGITHVIRGDDHVENTYKHIALYQAMGAKVPIFAHLPMITNSNGKPYSKRDGDAFVGDFRKNGFLSDALFNYLALLGWSPGDDREILSRHEMIELFSLDRCQSSPAQVDIKKLTWINYEYMLQVPDHEFRIEIEKELKKDGIEYDKATLEKVIPLIRDRVKIFSDIAPLSRFLFQDDYQYNEKAVKKKLIRENVKENLERLCKHFLEVEIFNADSLEQILHDFVESNEIGLAEIMPPLRVCVSGQQGGPDLCPVLELLGREEVVHRIERAIEKFL